MKFKVLIPATLFALGAAAATAGASPNIGTTGTPGANSNIVTVAGRECMRDTKGWHYMDGNRRRDCRPSRPTGGFWGWKCDHGRCGWWHSKERRWND